MCLLRFFCVLLAVSLGAANSYSQSALPSGLKRPSLQFYAVTDCQTNVNSDQYTFTVSGTGSALNSLALSSANAVGLLQWACGTVATNRASIASANFSVMSFGEGTAEHETKVRIDALSNGTTTYSLRTGFIDSITAESADGCFFRYTDTVNSGKFQCVCRNNSTETATDSGITATAAAWYDMIVQVNAAGTSAVFRINNAIVGTITTNIPTASGREFGYGLMALRTVGTASSNIFTIDYAECVYNFSTAR